MDEQYAKDLEDGQVYQDFISLQLGISNFSSKHNQLKIGENAIGIEIKYDRMLEKTGNIWIETEQRSDKSYNWSPGGICCNDNSWAFLIGNYEIAFVFIKKLVSFLKNI